MMPCDRDFGDIERHMRKIECVYTHEVYERHIAEARVANKFVVTQMSAEKFQNIGAALSFFCKRNVTVEKKV